MRCPILVLALAMLAIPATAQTIDVTWSANPVALGTPVTLSVTAAIPNQFTIGGCLVTEIRATTPTGPVVRLFPCTFLGVAIPDCGPTAIPRTLVWNQTGAGTFGGQVPAGEYWFGLMVTNGLFGPGAMQWISLTIDAGVQAPSLSETLPTVQGNGGLYLLNAPLRPFDTYLVAMSGSTNTGFAPAPGLFIGLDIDLLFTLSLSNALPGILNNFQGSLDQFGQATAINIQIPPNSGLTCFPFFLQAAVVPAVGSAGVPELTNIVSTYIR